MLFGPLSFRIEGGLGTTCALDGRAGDPGDDGAPSGSDFDPEPYLHPIKPSLVGFPVMMSLKW